VCNKLSKKTREKQVAKEEEEENDEVRESGEALTV
jgi:hypothetical protein